MRKIQSLLFAIVGLLGCDDGKPLRATSGVGLHYTVVVDGVEVGDHYAFTPPKGSKLDVGSPLAFRYQTPCGPRDVAMTVESIDKDEHGRIVRAKAVDKPPTETLVLVDGRGGSVDLQIGSAKIPEAGDGHNHPSEPGAWYGRVLDVGCAKTHKVLLSGVEIGVLGESPDNPNSGAPGFQRVVFVSPKKDSCFIARYASVVWTRKGSRESEAGGWADVVIRGLGWLPFDPDVFMKETTDAKKPMALFEAPCP